MEQFLLFVVVVYFTSLILAISHEMQSVILMCNLMQTPMLALNDLTRIDQSKLQDKIIIVYSVCYKLLCPCSPQNITMSGPYKID